MFLKTEKLTIRKMTTEDLFPLYHVLSDPEVMEYLEPPFSMEAAKQFLYKAGICETPLIWAVEDARKVFIGYVIYPIIPMMKPAWSWDGFWIARNGEKGMQVQLLKW